MTIALRPGSRRWTYLAVAGGTVLVVGATAGVAYAGSSSSASSSGDTVHACVAQSNGGVRIVSEGASCKADEYAVSWNSAGQQGATGPAGPQGPTGAQGPAGAAAPDPTPAAKVVGTMRLTANNGDAVTFDIEGFSAEQEQSSTTGSQSGGAGAGKVTFEPISITKLPDSSSPRLFSWLAAGTTLRSGDIELYGADGQVAETYHLNLVALASLTTSNTGAATERLHEQLTFQVGGIALTVGSESADWNRVTNTDSN